jgi:hypothetical protein
MHRRARTALDGQAIGEQAFDDAVERAGAERDTAIGSRRDVFDDGVAVPRLVGESDEDVKHGRRQRQEGVWVAVGRHAS